MKIKIGNISAKKLIITSFLLSFTIAYVYGNGPLFVYAFLELTVAMFCYWGFLKYFNSIDGPLRTICAIIIPISVFGGLINSDLKSTFLLLTSFIMPFYISTWKIQYKDGGEDYSLATVLAVILMYLAINMNLFGDFNSNSLGFLGFMGISLGFIWVKCAPKKNIPLACVIFGIIVIAFSGSRNVALVGLICIGLLLLPKHLIKKKSIYFGLCSLVLLYTVLASTIMQLGFSNPFINDFLIDFTSQYSNKAWAMSDRVSFLNQVYAKIEQRGILLQLFGTGVLSGHGHNMFYQCLLIFGYFGTLLIYIMFIRVFNLAYILIKNNSDDVVLGCVIALLGNLLLQGADVYILGTEAYPIIPQVIMGIILHRYKDYITYNKKLKGYLHE